MSEWQPIETAPKDGITVILWAESWELSWGVTTGFFDGEFWSTAHGTASEFGDEEDDEFEGNFGPSHWMHLPSPPTPHS